MLLCLLSYTSFMQRNPRILISFISGLIRNIADSVVHSYAVKLSLIYLVSSVGASSYENRPIFLVACDNSSMHLDVDFVSRFNGVVYTSGDAYNPECSFPTSPTLNNTNIMLTLPFSTCHFNVSAIDEERISISSAVVIQQHRMMATSHDILHNVTCELPLPMDTFRQWYYPNTTLTADHLYTGLRSAPEVTTWIETRIGSDIFPDDDSEIGAELFLVVYVTDGGKNKDMSVQNCIAHDDQVLTNETLLYQMSDVFGCPNASYVLSNFTVQNQTEGQANLMAYTQMGNLAYTVKGEFFVTCGVLLCKDSCPDMCEEGANPKAHYLSDIAVKRFVGRLPGATLPPSLDLFETRQRIFKRSFSEVFSRWFSFGSSDTEVKEGNHTSESTLISSEEQLENTTDQLDAASIAKDLEVHTFSDNPFGKFTIMLANETRIPVSGQKYKVSKFSVWPEIIVCVVFMFFVSCYAGLLYSNSKRNLKNTAADSIFMTEFYSIVY